MFDGPHHPRRTARSLIAVIVALTAGLGLATSASADQRFAPSALADAAPAAASAGRATPRIVGGHSLRDTSSAPYTVALQTKFSAKEVGSCSGTVLDALHVLTAAHCVVNKGVAATPENVRVAAGASDLTSDAGIALATVANVARIRVHPHYVSTEFADDVAVLTLAAPLDLTTGKVAALPMAPVGTTLDAGRSVRVTGFGISRTGKDDFGTLRSVTTRAVTAGLCGTTAPAAMLCTYRDQHAACEGDSGGTATIGSPRLLIGVTDLAVKNCAAGLNLYANVAAPEIRGFIDAAVAEQDLTREQIPLAPRGGRTVRMLGTPEVGRTVTCRAGSWTASPKFRYAFFRIKGNQQQATKLGKKRTYRLRASDRGWQFGCAVEASNAGGTGVSFSRTVRTVR